MANSIEWVAELREKYISSISHVFITHGNTKDIALVDLKEIIEDKEVPSFTFIPVDSLLIQAVGFCDYVFVYDRAEGWIFKNESSKAFFNTFVKRLENEVDQGNAVGAANTRNSSLQAALQTIGQGEATSDLALKYKDPVKAFYLVQKFLRNTTESEKIAVIIDHAEALFSSEGWSKVPSVDLLVTYMRKWAMDPDVSKNGHMVVLNCKDNLLHLHPALRDPETKVEAVEIPYPTKEERKKAIIKFLSLSEVVKDKTEEEKEDLAIDLTNSTSGLNLTLIEDCMLRADLSGAINPAFIKERKDAVIKLKYDDVIEVSEPAYGFDVVGGLDRIKEYFEKNVITPLKDGNYRRCPMGVLMTGPPGTGKSLVAEAVAKACGVLFINLRFSKIFSKYVGDSERNLDRILYAIKNMSPAIVFIDEIDQAGHNRGGQNLDSGVGSRIFQRLLEFMSDTENRGKVVFLAATNRPDLMDPAMKRAGRFDRKVPFLPPNGKQRAHIVKALCRKYSISLDSKVIPEEFIKATSGYVGADLETILLSAYETAEDFKGKATKANMKKGILPVKFLTEAAGYIVPSVSSEQVQQMSKLAILECNDTRMIPKEFVEAS